jgi:hypothetical protein
MRRPIGLPPHREVRGVVWTCRHPDGPDVVNKDQNDPVIERTLRSGLVSVFGVTGVRRNARDR